MHIVVFIPGIMGSRLALKQADGSVDEVWPPTPFETKFGYKRIESLMNPSAFPTGLVDKVLCFSFYETITTILNNLGFSENGAEQRLVLFPYDWRQDLFGLAGALADRLDAIGADKAAKISIVAHSMGGLITRLLLESGTYSGRKWFKKIDQFIALAVPHLGAPLALARVLGLDSTLGVSGSDFVKFSSNPAYPSGYQLLPSPAERCCWDQSSAALDGFDIYDPKTAKRLGLVQKQLDRAKAMHAVLDPGQPPKGIRYFYFAGTGHRTVTRLNVSPLPDGTIDHEDSVLTRTPDGGDGTVPLYSALPRQGQRQIVVNEHSTVFEGDPFLRVFVRLLGGNEGPALEKLAALEKGMAKAAKSRPLALSVEAPVVSVQSDIEVVMTIAAEAVSWKARTLELSGKLVLERFVDDANTKAETVATIPVDYAGPPIGRLVLLLPPQDKPGHYRLKFKGKPAAGNTPVFAVSSA